MTPVATGELQSAMPESGGVKLPQQLEKAAEPPSKEVSPLPSTGTALTDEEMTPVVLALLLGLTLGLAGWRALHVKHY